MFIAFHDREFSSGARFVKLGAYACVLVLPWCFCFSGPVRCEEGDRAWQATPELVKKFTDTRKGFNYDETKVPSYSLTNPLRLAAGGLVETSQQWHAERRPELMELFRHHVYGRRPIDDYQVRFELGQEIPDAFDGKATGQALQVVIQRGTSEFAFPVVMFVPKQIKHKVPAAVLINNRYFVPLEKAMAEHDPFWPVETLIDRGYATASFHTSDVDPDRRDGYAGGIRSFLAAGEAPADDAWRSLSAWGWAASRVLDYLETIESIDTQRVAVVGHSRGGKTALWAACEDPRFAIAYSNNSGCGGAALSRRAYGETVGRITTSFPHWFTPNFAAFAEREHELPIDQHEVIALLAPRAVYVASADADLWADPRGEYASIVAAAPVFELLGKKSIVDPVMPALDQQRIVGQTGYHIRPGGHGLEQSDWERFLDFADQVLE